jgi:hypothetical protein
MAQSISNIKELSNLSSEVKVLNYTEELEKINKVKHSLGMLYFAVLTIMMTTLFF